MSLFLVISRAVMQEIFRFTRKLCCRLAGPSAVIGVRFRGADGVEGATRFFGDFMRLLGKALTFDDVLLVSAYSEVLPKDTSLQTRLTRTISLNLPLVSAAMDTVTESRLAISMAQEGGIGIIHKNLTAQEQATHVAKVKRQ